MTEVPSHAPADYDCPFCAVVRGDDNPPWHYHLHVFPRYDGDDLYGSAFRDTAPDERSPSADLLRAALARSA